MKFNQKRNVRAERWSTALGVISFDLLVLGIFLALYFINSSGYTSNVEVLLENYRTDQCQLSTFAPLARRVTLVPAASSHQCVLRESTGITGDAIYAAAFCDNSSGILTIQVKIGSSQSDCSALPFTPYPAGACIQLALLLKHVNNSGFLLFQCGTTASVRARFAAFQALNADGADTDITRPQGPPESLVQPNPRKSFPSNLFISSRLFQAVASNVTSTSSDRYESAGGDGALVSGDTEPGRLVVQLEDEVFDPATLGASTSAVESMSSIKSVSESVAALGPLDGDYPVGFLFNNFNLPGELPLFDAGPGSARYYGIRGSGPDIGQHMLNLDGVTKGGFTISMYLRCSRTTAGFAYAVADAREDMISNFSPLLVRLMTMLANGSPGSAWYNSTYNVYSGLFVNGPGALLHFVYANPTPNSPLVDLVWDLTALGQLRLFNGVWHHVAIIIRSENQDTKVQLVVDGVTSVSQNGWNLCPARVPIPIQELDAAAEITVRNFQAERVLTDGVLFTGYFNGGVAHLQFTNEKVALFDLWRSSTIAIRDHNAINTAEYIALGSVLLAVGTAMLATMLCTSGREWLKTERSISQDEEQYAQEAYDELWQKEPRDVDGEVFTMIPWSVALRCMGCDVRTMAIFLDELRFNFEDPPEHLVRLLYAKATAGTGTVDSSIQLPTAAQWRALFPDEEDNDFCKPVTGVEGRQSEWTEESGDEPRMNPLCSSGIFFGSSSQLGNSTSSGVPQVARRKSSGLRDTGPRRFFGVSDSAEGGGANRRTSSKALTAATRQAKGNVNVNKGDLGLKSSSGGSSGIKSNNHMPIASKAPSRFASATPSSSELAQSVLSVVQSISVWQTSLPFPAAHLATFQVAFATFSLDFTALVNVSPLVTPLVQLFVGLVVFGVLLFVVESDEKAFLWNLARYVVVRDTVDKGISLANVSNLEDDYMSEVTADFESMLGEVPDNGLHFTVPLLPLHQSKKIQDFVSGDRRQAIASVRAISVHDNNHTNFTLQKPPGARDDCPVSYLYVRSNSVLTTSLRRLGHCCALHANRVLGPQLQTTVWPYKYRPSCCVETHGRRCSQAVGKMYVCGEIHEKNGETAQCKYAVCEKHFRPPLIVNLLTPLVGLYRSAMQRGFLWFIVTVFLLLANACYTPFMKTALMILACDPTYQCQFQHCWEAPDRLFILAAYLCLVIVTFYGVGFPLSMAILLHRRKRMLHEVFFSDVYSGRFEDTSEPGQVDILEWLRFVITDPTALGKLYLSFELNWIYVPPILLFWKAAILAPAVFIERNTFPQLAGVAAVQFLFGVFLFVTEPSISPVVDLMYKLGSAHQMLLLGVLSLNTRQLYEGSTDLGPLTVAITATYLLICIAIFAGVTLVPVFKGMLEVRRVVRHFDSLGMYYSQAIGMYVVPRSQPLFSESASTQCENHPALGLDQTVNSFVLGAAQTDSQRTTTSGHMRLERRAGSTVHLVEVQPEETFVSPTPHIDAATESHKAENILDEVCSDEDVLSTVEDDVLDNPITLRDDLIAGIVDANKSEQLNTLQHRILAAVFSGKDCLAAAPAGSGKSTAGAIFVLQCLDLTLSQVQVIVVCSSPEKAAALVVRLQLLGSHMTEGQPFVKLLDGTNQSSVDVLDLQQHPEEARIVVGTMRGLLRLSARKILDMTHVRHFILDDADVLLDRSKSRANEETNVDHVRRLALQLPAPTVITMLARDLTADVRETAAMLMRQPEEVATEKVEHHRQPEMSSTTQLASDSVQGTLSNPVVVATVAQISFRHSETRTLQDLDVDFEIPEEG